MEESTIKRENKSENNKEIVETRINEVILTNLEKLKGPVPIKEMIKSVNFHITKRCNYDCRFCFARFNLVDDHLGLEKSIELISLLAETGMQKITFVGGEPTLVSYLPELVKHAFDLGVTTMMVTNGTRISEDYLDKFEGKLDWIGLSIDSGLENINKELGRGKGKHVALTMKNAQLIRKRGIKLKINTVVTALNWNEDLNWLIEELGPERWKVFQMLPIKGENDDSWDLLIDKEQFEHYLGTHRVKNPTLETNNLMTGSYVMIDPQGRLFHNNGGVMNHLGDNLLKRFDTQIYEYEFDVKKFEERGGSYKW